MDYGFLFNVEEHYSRDLGFNRWTGYNRTIVGGDDTMGSDGNTCMYDTKSSQLLYAAHESRNEHRARYTDHSTGDILDDVTSTTRWLGPQYAWEDAPSGKPFFGEPSTHVTDGSWQSRTGPYVLHPYDGCCEASIPDAVDRTQFHVAFLIIVIKEYKVQRYRNGIPYDHPWNEVTREWDTLHWRFEGIYRGSDACDGVTSLVCDGACGGGGPESGPGWPMCISGIPWEVEDAYCPSVLTRCPNDVRFSFVSPDSTGEAPIGVDYAAKVRFKITNMSFS